jgi:hypothetical protein
MWADPRTCLTHRVSGMPIGRRVSAYCYAPPCLASASLSKLAASSNLIISFVYSHDVVSRLSLGSVRDLRRAAAWLSEAESRGWGDGYGGVTGRALKAKARFLKNDDSQWVGCILQFTKTMLLTIVLAVLSHTQNSGSEHAYESPLPARPSLMGHPRRRSTPFTSSQYSFRTGH